MPLELVGEDNGVVVLTAPRPFVADYVRRELSGSLIGVFRDLIGNHVRSIRVEVLPPPAVAATA